MSEAQPSQVSGQLKSVQGQAYQAIGSVSSDPSWQSLGEELVNQGQDEVERARLEQKGEAAAERVEGKVQSAYGMLTGSQDHLNRGNLKAEEGEWRGAAADGTVPVPSLDRVKGKVQSAVGMATGDAEMQKEGNMKAEKAEWTKG
ncbi:hypothetical protein JCM11641_005026 [Rhodosporidiobolus odoratus]